MAGAISGTIRFICHLPWGYYGFTGNNHYQFIKGHTHLLIEPPLDQKVSIALGLNGPGGIVAFFWNFFMWIPTILAGSSSFLFFLGIVDSLIVAMLIAATVLESSFIGHTKGHCAQLSSDRANDSTLVFFERAATTNTTDVTLAKDLCNEYLSVWATGIALICLYGISAISNVLISMGDWESDGYHDRGWDRSCWKTLALAPLKLFRAIFCCFLDLRMVILPFRLRRCLHYAERYTNKLSQHLGRRIGAFIRHKLFRHPVLNNIELEVLFCGCGGIEQYKCWSCSAGICNLCSQTCRCPPSKISFHMGLCRAYCSGCYYKRISRWPPDDKCDCIDGRNPPRRSHAHVTRNVCGNCKALNEGNIFKSRTRRDWITYERLIQLPLECAQCNEYLPRNGLIWWVCSICKHECRSSEHKEWDRSLE